jgi:hypothetical protein
MNAFECPREQDVLDAVASRRWPNRANDELRAHVAGCASCADLITVAAALLDADDDRLQGELPPASLVWWRAQLSAREEAARFALRPIRVAQAVTLVSVAVVLFIALSALAPAIASRLAATLTRSISTIAEIDAHTKGAADLALSSLANRGVQLAAGAWLVLAPVAAYLAFSKD